MKRSTSLRWVAIPCAALMLAASAFATTIVGTGSSASYLVIEAGDFGTAPLVYEYRYTFSSISPLDTYDMLAAIDDADDSLSFSFVNYRTEASPNYFLTAITYQSITLTNTGSPDYEPFWTQSVAGGKAGYISLDPVAEGEWSEGYGVSYPYRELEDGSWDGFYYGVYGDTPSVEPVPEPSAVLLLAAGSGAVLWQIRRRRYA